MQGSVWRGRSADHLSLLAGTLLAIGAGTACRDAEAVSAPAVPEAIFAFTGGFSSWTAASRVDRAAGAHPRLDHVEVACPLASVDATIAYIASDRPGGLGGLDLWVSTRDNASDRWSAPVNPGDPLNSPSDDLCPAVSGDGILLHFVSRRPGGCGAADVYVSRRREALAFDPPELLTCDASAPYDAVNSPFDELAPFIAREPGSGMVLYFSSVRPGGVTAEATGPGDSDIYRSAFQGGAFGAAVLVPAINSAADEGQPNVRADGRELLFSSTRVLPGVSLGGADLYAATRHSPFEPWSMPVNLGPMVNSAGEETRPWLSADGTALSFGSTRHGSGEVLVTTRDARRRRG